MSPVASSNLTESPFSFFKPLSTCLIWLPPLSSPVSESSTFLPPIGLPSLSTGVIVIPLLDTSVLGPVNLPFLSLFSKVIWLPLILVLDVLPFPSVLEVPIVPVPMLVLFLPSLSLTVILSLLITVPPLPFSSTLPMVTLSKSVRSLAISTTISLSFTFT